MARMTDIEVLEREMQCVQRRAKINCTNCGSCDLLMDDGRILTAYRYAIAALRGQQEAEKNEPLTLEELLEMDGQPVWITPGGFWALVIAIPGERVKLISNDGERVYADKEIELVGPIYRRPPEVCGRAVRIVMAERRI